MPAGATRVGGGTATAGGNAREKGPALLSAVGHTPPFQTGPAIDSDPHGSSSCPSPEENALQLKTVWGLQGASRMVKISGSFHFFFLRRRLNWGFVFGLVWFFLENAIARNKAQREVRLTPGSIVVVGGH